MAFSTGIGGRTIFLLLHDTTESSLRGSFVTVSGKPKSESDFNLSLTNLWGKFVAMNSSRSSGLRAFHSVIQFWTSVLKVFVMIKPYIPLN